MLDREALRVLMSRTKVATPTLLFRDHIDMKTPNSKLRDSTIGRLLNDVGSMSSSTSENAKLQSLMLTYSNKLRNRMRGSSRY